MALGWRVKLVAALPLLFGAAVDAHHEAYQATHLVAYAVLLPLTSLAVILAAKLIGTKPTLDLFANYVLAAVLGLYCAEAILDWQLVGPALGLRRAPPVHPTAMDGSPFDYRLKSEVVVDLRRQFPGRSVIPQLSPESILDHGFPDGLPTPEGGYVLPLAGPSHSIVVTCNEMGYWGSFESDRFGLNNPDEIWNTKLRIATLGSSHTQGLCLRSGEGWVDKLRHFYPDVVNLGQSNSGALYQFALVKEYLSELKPNLLVWVFCDCFDATALSIEFANATLLRYLEDPAFSQNLRSRQKLIDEIEGKFLDETAANVLLRYRLAREEVNMHLWNLPTLATLRSSIKRTLGLKNYEVPAVFPTDDGGDYAAFREVMTLAKEHVASWGGRIHVVFLPDVHSQATRMPSPYRRKVLAAAKDLGFTATDLYAVFDRLPDPAALHPFSSAGHFTPEGSRVFAAAVAEDLRAVLP